MRPRIPHTARYGALLLALLLLPAEGSGTEAGAPNPHAFMSDPSRCADCHKEAPERGQDDYTTVAFVDSIVALCVTCHEDAHLREEHPIEIRPEFEVPADFHLDNHYTITCATCHDPHGPHEAKSPYVPTGFTGYVRTLLGGETAYPTLFLRRANTSGELCLSCHREGIAFGEEEDATALLQQYVGSEVCRECHAEIYDEWKMTLHSENFLDATKDPGVVRGKFEGDDPFPQGEILYTVGEHWTQRYIVDGKRGLMVRPESWSITGGKWVKGGSFKRPWLKYCAGCHTTALNPFTGAYVERGTGCESCHGPGLQHTETTDQYDVVNPALLVESRRNMVCEACHTSGHDRSGAFRYPVGFLPGENLMRFYKGLVPKSGQGAESYTGDGSYDDRHRQFLFWSERLNILEGLSCDVCTSENRPEPGEEVQEQTEYVLSASEACGTCHREVMENYEGHSGHGVGDAGCLDCHPPLLTLSGEAYSIHDHKFQFGSPPDWMVEGLDPCGRCHPGRSRDEAALPSL